MDAWARINFSSEELYDILFDPELTKYWWNINELARVHTLYGNQPSWYNLEREGKIENMEHWFAEWNKRISDLGIKMTTNQMNELIHIVQGNPIIEMHFWMFLKSI